MGKMLSLLIALSLLASLMVPARSAEPDTDYLISNQHGLGIARAFSDGDDTVLAFVDLDNQNPILTNSSGKRIRFRQVGDYAVLPGKYDVIYVRVGKDFGVVRAAPMTRQRDHSVAEIGAGSFDGLTGTGGRSSRTTVAVPSSNSLAFGSATAAPSITTPSNPGVPQSDATAVRSIRSGESVYELPFVKQSSGSDTRKTSAASVLSRSVTTSTPEIVGGRVISSPTIRIWEGKAPTDAKAMLQVWAKKANWDAIWSASFTFPVPATVRYEGTFEQAVLAHYEAYTDRRRTKTPVCIDMHRENKTVHVYQPDDSGKCDDLHTSAHTTAVAWTDKKITP